MEMTHTLFDLHTLSIAAWGFGLHHGSCIQARQLLYGPPSRHILPAHISLSALQHITLHQKLEGAAGVGFRWKCAREK